MKNLVAILGILGMITVGFQSACVVHPHAVVSGPAVRVHYQTISGRRVLVVPPGVRVGQTVVISGNHCVVRSIKRNRVKVVYPGGRVVWVDTVRR